MVISELPDIGLEALELTKYGLRDQHVHSDQSKIGSAVTRDSWTGLHSPKSFRCSDGLFKIVQYRLNPVTNQYG